MTIPTIRTVNWPVKDPEELLPYEHQYEEAAEDPISVSEWTVPSGLTGTNPVIISPDVARIWLSVGTAAQSYTIKNKVTLTSGKIIVRRAILQVNLR